MKTAKAWAALAGTLVTAFTAIILDDVITLPEVADLAQVAVLAFGTLLTALGVWRVPNTPETTGYHNPTS